MNNHLRSKTAIALRELGTTPKKPKEVVALLQGRKIPTSFQEFADFSYAHVAESRVAWDKAEEILNKCEDGGITAIALGDPLYPRRLKELQIGSQYSLCGFCPILFCKGSTAGLNAANTVAVVGTRTPTERGGEMARLIGRALAEKDVAVVSGLALGCDTEGHLGCLEAGGIGIAVLAHGLDQIYPKANTELAERLINGGGCLVSEYRPGIHPDRRKFAYRDRIQSGLSDAILVVETPEKDGTMQTADFAKRQGKALACVVYPATLMRLPQPAGNDLLLKKGAHKVTNPEQSVQFANNAVQNVKKPMIQVELV